MNYLTKKRIALLQDFTPMEFVILYTLACEGGVVSNSAFQEVLPTSKFDNIWRHRKILIERGLIASLSRDGKPDETSFRKKLDCYVTPEGRNLIKNFVDLTGVRVVYEPSERKSAVFELDEETVKGIESILKLSANGLLIMAVTWSEDGLVNRKELRASLPPKKQSNFGRDMAKLFSDGLLCSEHRETYTWHASQGLSDFVFTDRGLELANSIFSC